MKLDLQQPELIGHTSEDEVVGKQKIGERGQESSAEQVNEEIGEEKWQGKLMVNRWNEERQHTRWQESMNCTSNSYPPRYTAQERPELARRRK